MITKGITILGIFIKMALFNIYLLFLKDISVPSSSELILVTVISKTIVNDRYIDVRTTSNLVAKNLIKTTAIIPPSIDDTITNNKEPIKIFPGFFEAGKNLTIVFGNPRLVKVAINAPKLINDVARPTVCELKSLAHITQKINAPNAFMD